MWPYRGSWALVTGASAGLGAEFARQLAARGTHVALCARRRDRLEALAAELRQRYDVDVRVHPMDLTEPGAPERLWAEVDAVARVDVLVNNAGFGRVGRFVEHPGDVWEEMIALNVTAATRLAHAALRAMGSRRRGAVLNVASLAAFQPIPGMAVYAATKAYVLHWSEAIAEEARRDGLTVVTLCPGPVPTEFQQVAGARPVGPDTPGYVAPEAVVRVGLDALARGRSPVVPGWLNRVAAAGVRRFPLRWVRRLAGAALRRM